MKEQGVRSDWIVTSSKFAEEEELVKIVDADSCSQDLHRLNRENFPPQTVHLTKTKSIISLRVAHIRDQRSGSALPSRTRRRGRTRRGWSSLTAWRNYSGGQTRERGRNQGHQKFSVLWGCPSPLFIIGQGLADLGGGQPLGPAHQVGPPPDGVPPRVGAPTTLPIRWLSHQVFFGGGPHIGP
jgi:hypothetical protein